MVAPSEPLENAQRASSTGKRRVERLLLGARSVRTRWVFLVAALAAACGARTGLDVPLHHDAGPDAHPRLDAGLDVFDAPPDFPPLDPTKHDADTTGCPPTTFVYAVATNDMLLRFDPPSATFTPIAHLVCPAGGAHPFSMAVDRAGTAYVEYDSGAVFAVSTVDGSCKSTAYVADSDLPFGNFGMGYATIGAGPDEQLFVASETPGTLGVLDMVSTFSISPVAEVQPTISAPELTGTGDGRLFAYYAFGFNDGSYVAELDKATGAVIAQDYLPTVDRGTGWAFAFWGGDFWLFTTPGTQATVRYDPATKSATVVANYYAAIVGAGVSTCAPN